MSLNCSMNYLKLNIDECLLFECEFEWIYIEVQWEYQSNFELKQGHLCSSYIIFTQVKKKRLKLWNLFLELFDNSSLS